jgi:hypothetical protein
MIAPMYALDIIYGIPGLEESRVMIESFDNQQRWTYNTDEEIVLNLYNHFDNVTFAKT